MLRLAPQGQVVNVLARILEMDARRVAASKPQAPPAEPTPLTPDELEWAVWQDMVEEPWKYGDDILEWLQVDEAVRSGPLANRPEAYWVAVQAELDRPAEAEYNPWRKVYAKIAREAARTGEKWWRRSDIQRIARRYHAAIRTVQAAIRGHQARMAATHRDCCMCLAHRVSPIRTDVGMMCRECAEQGPYTDITGPVSDPWNWHRA